MRIPKITITRLVTGAKGYQEQAIVGLPDKYMDEYKTILGDAKAQVTVSADMAFKDYGSGAGSMVSVSLSCNQDGETIEKAIDMAGKIAREYAKEHQLLAEKEFMKGRTSNKAAPY